MVCLQKQTQCLYTRSLHEKQPAPNEFDLAALFAKSSPAVEKRKQITEGMPNYYRTRARATAKEAKTVFNSVAGGPTLPARP